MQPSAVHSVNRTESAPAAQGLRPPLRLRFVKVKDARGHKLRGLWRRGNRFYSQMAVFDSGKGRQVVRRVPLAALTVPEALKERNKLVAQRDSGSLDLPSGTTITFSALADEYLEYLGKGIKADYTVKSEKSSLKALKTVFGAIPIRSISSAQIQDYVASALDRDLSPGTINKIRSVLNNAMAYAKTRKYLRKVPDWEVEWLEYQPQTRRLIPVADLDAFCAVALEHIASPQSFVDYIRLMAYSGGRKGEVITLQWADVSFDNRQLRFRGETTKNGLTRYVNFNEQLETLLRAMTTRRRPESTFLFPSPWDKFANRPRSSFWADFAKTKRLANNAVADFHSLRHFFISTAVMAGIDYMTIAQWVGHQDGGVLIGKVYGHLNDQHKQNMANKLTFK